MIGKQNEQIKKLNFLLTHWLNSSHYGAQKIPRTEIHEFFPIKNLKLYYREICSPWEKPSNLNIKQVEGKKNNKFKSRNKWSRKQKLERINNYQIDSMWRVIIT